MQGVPVKMPNYTTIPNTFKDQYHAKFISIDKSKINELAEQDPVIFAYYFLGKKLRLHQAYILHKILTSDKSRFAMCMARQLGKSILFAVFSIWAAWYNKFPATIEKITNIYIISRDDEASMELLEKIRGVLRDGDSQMSQYYGDSNFFSGSMKEPNNTHQLTFLNNCTIKSIPPTEKILGKCLEENSLVLMSDGRWKKIKDVQIGEEVVCLDQLSYSTSKIIDKVNSGKKETYSVWLETGKEIIASAEHRILTRKGWKILKEITKDDRIACIYDTSSLSDSDFEIGESKLKILAYLLGDGSIKQSKVEFVNQNKELLDEFEECVIKEGCRIRKMFRNNCWHYAVHGYGYRNNHVLNWLREIGIQGKGSYDKFIPEFVFRLSKYQKSIFLNRLYSTDGWAIKNEIGYCSMSRTLVEQIRLLLLDFGIDASVRIKRVKYKDRQVFSNEATIKYNQGMTKFSEMIGIATKLSKGLTFGVQNQHETHMFNDVNFRKILRIEPRGVRNTYDIEVKDYHNFIANGIVVHNSASIVFIDEAHNLNCDDPDKFYNKAVVPTTAETGGKIILSSTPNGIVGFFYDAIDPDNKKLSNVYDSVWFSHSIWNDDTEECKRYQSFVQAEKDRMGFEGNMKLFMQEYEALFTVTTTAFFEHKDVDDAISDTPKRYEWKETPCCLGIDYGIKTSRTVLTIRTMAKDEIIQVWQYRCQADFDTNHLINEDWEHSIQKLKSRYNITMIVVDDCPQGDTINRWLESNAQVPVHKYNFRSDQMSKTDGINRNCLAYSYRAKLKEGKLKIPKWNTVQIFEMKIVQETEQKVLISIKAPVGHLCDTFDSDMMACLPFLDMQTMNDFEFDVIGSDAEDVKVDPKRNSPYYDEFHSPTDDECKAMIKEYQEESKLWRFD